MGTIKRLSVIFFIFTAFASMATAGISDQLFASDNGQYFYFGYSVDIDGDVAIVGASGDDEQGVRAGAAYIFRYDGSDWIQEVKLLPTGPTLEYDKFGWSVAIEGNLAAVSANNADGATTDSGAVYLFRYDGSQWAQEARLFPADGSRLDYFGETLALDDETLVVGAYGYDQDQASGLIDTGTAYVYENDGSQWVQTAQFFPTNPTQYETFGQDVAVEGTDIIVTANRDDLDSDPTQIRVGSASFFTKTAAGWQLEAKVVPSDLEYSGWFGESVALSGGRAIIGVRVDDNQQGTAYIFERDPANGSWTETAAMGSFGDRIGGERVDIDGVHALAGDDFYRLNASGQWEFLREYPLPGYGYKSVALSGNQAFFGDSANYEAGPTGAGTVYVETLPIWTDLGYGSGGTLGAPILSGNGILADSQSIQIDLQNAFPGRPYVLVYGTSAVYEPLAGGILVPEWEYALFGLSTDAAGRDSIPHTFPVGVVDPGTEFFFQAWVSDPSMVGGVSASNGIMTIAQ